MDPYFLLRNIFFYNEMKSICSEAEDFRVDFGQLLLVGVSPLSQDHQWQNVYLRLAVTAVSSSFPDLEFSRFFLQLFESFASFFKFFEVSGPVWTCSDLFGHVRMHSEALGCFRNKSETN